MLKSKNEKGNLLTSYQDRKINDFLHRHLLDPECFEWRTELERFLAEMESVRNGANGSVKMIPTWIKKLQPLERPVSVTAIDIGGTNVRSTVVTLDKKGIIGIDTLPTFATPGIQEQITTEEFFRRIVCRLGRHLETDNIGICFSLATIPLEDGDAIVSAGAKQIEVVDLLGKRVGQSFRNAARDLGFPNDQKITVINDTVAAALSGWANHQEDNYSGFAGFIYGTGTNVAYQENDEVMINIESGAYCGFPTGDIDDLFDATLIDANQDRFEKMVSGGYQGGLMSCILRKAVEENLLYTDFLERLTTVRKSGIISAKDISEYSHGGTDENVFYSTCRDDYERFVLVELFEAVCRRSALLCSITIIGALLRAKKDTEIPAFITAEGSTYLKQMNSSKYLDAYLQKNGKALGGLPFVIYPIENAVIKGTAISAL